MSDPPVVDLGALSAKLRQDDQQFRRTFALGQLAADGAGAAAGTGPASASPPVPVRNEGGEAGGIRARLIALIETRTGLDAGASAAERLDRVLASVPAMAQPAWAAALEADGGGDGPGWEALIAALTVQETYFFRDPDQLEFLRRPVLAELIAARRLQESPRLTCWCAGCASGEEAYTLAILIVEALREVGEAELRPGGEIVLHPRWRLSVLGTDIDRSVLRQAQAGRYLDFPMGPFRSLPAGLSACFEREAGPNPPGERPGERPGVRMVRPEIRALVGFRPFNLCAAEPPVFDCDLILCRNVLIYLSDRVRSHAQGLFHRALAPAGHLALGPTDTLKHPDLFQPRWGRDTVVYRKR